MQNQIAIEINNLTKFYGKERGIVDVNLQVKKGEIFGFLGPNGAGKTTTIRILLNFIRPTKGCAFIFGLNAQNDSLRAKEKIGYLPGEFCQYENLTAGEYLNYLIKFNKNGKKENIINLAKRMHLDLNKKIKQLSKGNKQKVAIIQALMSEPELLILDEPTASLDPIMQNEFYSLIKEFKKMGKTIFLSSHILSEVEKECDRVGIIKEGKLLTVEEISHIREKRPKVIEVEFEEEIKENEFKLLQVEKIYKKDKKFIILMKKDLINEAIYLISKFKIKNMKISDITLEEFFFEYYKDENIF